MITPVHKLDLTNVDKNDKPLVVLLTTGGFCPIHEGHLKMMEIAKSSLESQGVEVIGGYFSPSHDAYMRMKCAEQALSASKRLAHCEEFLQQSDWLMVDPWEALCHHGEINFTEVINRLGAYLASHLKSFRPINIYYVFGSDNARFALAFCGMGHGVCVLRQGYEDDYHEYLNHPLVRANPNIIFAPEHKLTPKIASSDLRSNLQQDKKRRLSLFLRDDETWSLEGWVHLVGEKALKLAQKNCLKELIELIQNHCKKSNWIVDIKNESLTSQREAVKNLFEKNKKVISLDPCIPGDYQLQISRKFNMSARSRGAHCIERPGSINLEDQLAHIPDDEYVIFDDDIASGMTMKFIRSILPARIKASDFLSLNRLEERDEDSDTTCDSADFRDFIIGAKEAGLVVELPDHQQVRVPYVLPYVYPSSRLSLPIEQDLPFSLAVWRMNLHFFETFEAPILVSHASPAFQQFANYLNFHPEMPLSEVCHWHINHLSRCLA
jgi:nicotinic acid mononucleotide adenylyltransferase